MNARGRSRLTAPRKVDGPLDPNELRAGEHEGGLVQKPDETPPVDASSGAGRTPVGQPVPFVVAVSEYHSQLTVNYDPPKVVLCHRCKKDPGCHWCDGAGSYLLESSTFGHVSTLFQHAGIEEIKPGQKYVISIREVGDDPSSLVDDSAAAAFADNRGIVGALQDIGHLPKILTLPEQPSEHVINALAILTACGDDFTIGSEQHIAYALADIEAAKARLNKALGRP